MQMENFPDASSYCQHFKSITDQLANVGAPVTKGLFTDSNIVYVNI